MNKDLIGKKITKNFWWSEFLKSKTADRLGIDNTPSEAQCAAIIHHHEVIRQPLRDKLEAVLHTSSGFRCRELAGWINIDKKTGKPRYYLSHHECLDGFAASDNECFAVGNNSALANLIVEMDLPFDQLILEYYTPGKRDSGWVHVSSRLPQYGGIRKQIKTKNHGEGYVLISPAELAKLAKE